LQAWHYFDDVFGISVTEIAVIVVVALVVVGPQKLPGMLRTLGEWIRKLRTFTTEMRAQTGIDDILRQEGFEGGLQELRALMRGDLRTLGSGPRARSGTSPADPYAALATPDRFREYPTEGADAAEALSDDLVDEDALRRIEGDEEDLAG
jgi:sec-independent protein translocase protein TatB